MSILSRYLIRSVVASSLLVLLVLLSLGGFINFVGQLEDIGTGRYDMAHAISFVLLSVPAQAYEMFPVSVLLGALLGLGNMASGSELTAMRTAGVSVWRLAGSVMLAGAALMLLTVLLGEFLAPPAERFARALRTTSMNESLSMSEAESAWIKDGDRIINIESRPDRRRFGGVFIFQLDEAHGVRSIARALTAGFSSGQSMDLHDFRESQFSDEGVQVRREARTQRPTGLRPELINLSVVDPDSLETLALYEYAGYLKENGLDAYDYEVGFWSRIANMLAVLLMAALALPFVFGSLRSAGAGQRLMVGVLLGIAYLVGSRTLASSGAVFEVNAVVIAWLPTAILAGVVFLGLFRVR